VVIALMALPWHAAAFGRSAEGVSAEDLPALLGVPPGLFVGALAAWLPLRAGARALARMEF
jgi:hypothetical protein